MWITIYFKSGKIIETIIHSLGELDSVYDIKDISRIDMCCRTTKGQD